MKLLDVPFGRIVNSYELKPADGVSRPFLLVANLM
jgi:hypothetical protein